MRYIRFWALVMLLLCLGTGFVFADGESAGPAEYATAALQLDGAPVATDVPPIIKEGRTLIPARALFEAMGGEVLWDSEASMVTIALGNYKVQLTIDSKTAFVNGAQKEMDVPAQILDGRTLIPVRFVAEALQCTVDWDNNTRTVQVSSPGTQAVTNIGNVQVETLAGGYRVMVTGDSLIGAYKATAYESPDRFGVDIYNAAFPAGTGSLSTENEIFRSVRFSQFDADTFRVVVDLDAKKAGRVSLSPDRTALYIDFESIVAVVPQEPGTVTQPQEPGTAAPPEQSEEPVGPQMPEMPQMPETPEMPDMSNLPELPEGEPEETTDGAIGGPTGAIEGLDIPALDWRMAGKLIAIDPGHGGSDVGAQGYQNGSVVLNEKDLNLAIALRLNEILQLAGASSTLLRDEDTYMSLYSRPEAANALNADLLISVHNNSADSAKANGTEVHYYKKDGELLYGYSSKTVAEHVQRELILEIGLVNRGSKSSPHLAVLNKSLMPAIIIEGAFLSNPGDLAHMMTEDFIEEYAVGAARGIIKALNASVEE